MPLLSAHNRRSCVILSICSAVTVCCRRAWQQHLPNRWRRDLQQSQHHIVPTRVGLFVPPVRSYWYVVRRHDDERAAPPGSPDGGHRPHSRSLLTTLLRSPAGGHPRSPASDDHSNQVTAGPSNQVTSASYRPQVTAGQSNQVTASYSSNSGTAEEQRMEGTQRKPRGLVITTEHEFAILCPRQNRNVGWYPPPPSLCYIFNVVMIFTAAYCFRVLQVGSTQRMILSPGLLMLMGVMYW